MAQIAREELERLEAALDSQDCLRRVVDEIAKLQRVVFHGNERADWELVRTSARQILMAEIVTRHYGNPEGVFLNLRALEDAGRSWDAAITELATAIHSYFTTPLGVVLRQDLFGDAAVFLTPDAVEWSRRLRGDKGAT